MSGGLIAHRKATRVEVGLPDLKDGGFSWLLIPSSRTLYAAAYDGTHETIRLVFRESGKIIEYRDFNGMRWFNFMRSKHKGTYARKYIISRSDGREVTV